MKSQTSFTKALAFGIVLLWLSASAFAKKSFTTASPDGKYEITFHLNKGDLYYSVIFGNTTIMSDSKLSITLDKLAELSGNFKIIEAETDSKSGSWSPVVGTKRSYPDAYNETLINLVEKKDEKRQLVLRFRAYNEGVAFRYYIPQQEHLSKYTIVSENSEFQFTADHDVYFDDYPQAAYSKVKLSEMPDNAIRPLLLESGDHFIAIAEAGSVEHYAPLKLSRIKENCLISQFRRGTVKVDKELTTPWRVIMVAEDAGTLAENHYLLQNLSPENAIGKTDWIKPGKCWRSGLTTKAAKAIIDKAVEWNYQYVHYDAGWYGPERDPKSNPIKPIEGIDIQEVTRYAKERGKGLICYINKIAMSGYDMENTFKTYEEWGISGLKFGFVDWESQEHMEFLYKAIRCAAKYHMIVDIHDNYRMTGMERTYPNLLTVEGILGNEERATDDNPPLNVLTTAFARAICGAGDFTPCYLKPRVVSRSFQLALGIVFYSPLQYLHWYDSPHNYKGEYPELEFWAQMPCTWDDSQVLAGEVGSYMSVARKSGDDWFVGTIVNEAKTMDILLSFLDEGSYVAKIYKEKSNNKKYVEIQTLDVTKNTTLKAVMSEGSGHAIWITER